MARLLRFIRQCPGLHYAEAIIVTGLILLALVPRLLLASGGTYGLDMLDWVTWSRWLNSGDLHTFYQRSQTDYLPGYLYVLLAIAKVAPLMQHLPPRLSTWLLGENVLYKLPAIAADVATVHLIYWAGRRWANTRAAVLAAGVYALNPGVLATSARWGQVDSIPAYLMLLALVFCIERRPALCGITLTLSFLTKPTALILVPLLLTMFLYRREYWGAVKLGGASLITFVALLLPFQPHNMNIVQFARFAFENTSGHYHHITINAFNFWASYSLAQSATAGTLQDSFKALGLSYFAWGWIAMAAAVVLVISLVSVNAPRAQEHRPYFLLPAAAVLLLSFFIVLTRLHERHLLPTLPFLAATCMLWPRFWLPYLWLSAAYLLNLMFSFSDLLPWHPPFPRGLEIALVSDLNIATAGMTVVLLVYALRSASSAWHSSSARSLWGGRHPGQEGSGVIHSVQ